MFDFIGTLSESKLFPTVQNLQKVSDKDLTEWAIMNLCALRVLLAIENTVDWARVYARKTASYGKFDQWRSNGTDLYLLLQSISSINNNRPDEVGIGLNTPNVLAWLKQSAMRRPDEYLTRRVFLRIDYDLKVRNESVKAIRRLTMDWYRISHYKRQLLFTRLLQYFRSRMRRSELLIQMERVARHHDLELHDEDQDFRDGEIVRYR